MRQNKKLILNTIMLTAMSLFMRSVGLVFQVYVSKRIGSAGIGLYYLILSVSIFAATVAISGIRFTTTRLVSEEIGRGSCVSVRAVVKKCLIYAALCGTFASLMLYFGADFIGTEIIKDGRTVLSLRILSLSLPFLSMGAVMTGYFIAMMRAVLSAVDQLTEQLIRMAVIAAVLSFGGINDVEHACAALVIGGVAGEIAGFFVIFALYKYDIRKCRGGRPTESRTITRRILSTAVPLALTAYARTALSTIQNILVPRGLRRSGATSELALSQYGMIQGMVFPIITFPSSLFISLSELIVPELTCAQMRGEEDGIRRQVVKTLRLCLVFSVFTAGVFFCFADEFGALIYSSREVEEYIRTLSLLMPVMYMDTVTDGMLRGLGQQIHSMRYNIIDSLISTVMIYFIVPSYAVKGYIFVLYFSEIFNFSLSFRRLHIVSGAALSISDILLPILFSAGTLSFGELTARFLFSGSRSTTALIFKILSACAVYCLIYGVLRQTRRKMSCKNT